ncbi:ras-interacting protein RIP3-like isoform X2 [Mizuhopecten yessoensis]|uniref:ras-interacting protein RIP3-like isoform X2 n=1 Tax=Mizuhopecten yessoensis TaxID=6573 RepID=UPI000B458D5B|nr:ras-interacting protein RIP3-like isoform X2 [Mizuhopecten yessoensis]
MVRDQVELTANLEENSAALMTSDRGTSGGAELTLTTPVTPKTAAGLNPNATVFSLSNKTSTTQPQPDTSTWDGVNANDEYQHANGDVGKGEVGGADTSAESPLSSDVSSSYTDNQLPAVTTFPAENTVVDAEDNIVNANSVTEDQLRQMLKEQLENCFSRESLASDRYLQSQMDADQYVPIATVANLQQIQQLTNDLDLITELLKELPNVQVHEVDGKCEKVRPNHNRCIVILREIPESTPLEDVKNLFKGESCPRFVSCEFAANDSWYVTFDSDASAQQAYQYLREEQCTFLNKPILARIKAKPLIRMTYPRNGYRPQYHQQQQAVQQQQQQQQTQQQTVAGVTSPPAVPVSQAEQVVVQQQQSQQQTQQQTQYQVQQQVPIMTPYINGQQTLPFFPNAALLPSWPTNVNVSSPTLLDPSMVITTPSSSSSSTPIDFMRLMQAKAVKSPTWSHRDERVLAINGYQATSVAKLNSGPRHQYNNVNRNSRNQRPVRLNQEHRMHSDNRPNQDRQQGPSGGSMDRRGDNTGGGGGGSHRTSPRNSDSSQISGHHSPFHRDSRRGDNSNMNHSHMVHSSVQQQQHQTQPVTDNNSNITVNNRQSDNLSQRMPRSYRSRRRRDDEGARNMRPSSSQAVAKDSKLPSELQFDLEINSFPPLPGPVAANSSTAGDVFESKLSDVVKGTAKPLVRESKASPPPVPPPPPPPSASVQSPPVAMVTPQPQIPVAVTATTTSVPATTRPSSPPKSRESTTTTITATTSGSSGNTSTVPSGGNASCTATATPVTRVPSPPVIPQKSVKTASMPESQPKSAESHVSQRPVSSAPKTQEKPVPVQQQAQVKLTYAQMLARGREAEAASAAAAAAEGGSKQRSSDESGEEDSKTAASVRASQTLKEQSQTIKTTSANSRPPVKDQGRRDFEPKDQRFGGGRRAKENRERRDRRRSERDGSRSSTK